MADETPKSGGAGWLAGCGVLALANLGCFMPILLGMVLFVGYMSVNGLTPSGGGGTVSSTVPDSLKPIFQKAGASEDVSPNLIAAIFGYGEHCGARSGDTCTKPQFPEQGPWASNPDTNASGPFQFMECTWEGSSGCNNDGVFSSDLSYIRAHGGLGRDCDGDGKADVQSLSDASCAAGAHLAGQAKGVTGTSAADLQKVYDAAFAYNRADWYAKAVQAGYVVLSGSSP